MHSDKDDWVESILKTMKAHFGNAAKAYWVYYDELCPCCRTRPIDVIDWKGEKALSINGFMYRERGVLIGYLLCEACVKEIMAKSKFGPTSLHKSIEQNLKDAYQRHLDSHDA
ncbi:MAG: hypothetical protein ACYDBB_27240 [Armatimonadota bacterium]